MRTIDVIALCILVLAALRWAWARLRARGKTFEIERRFDKVMRRYDVEIDRFKLSRQKSVETILNHDHAIWTHVERLAHAGEDRFVLRKRVQTYVHEIVPAFNPSNYFRYGYRFTRWLINILYKVDFDPEEVKRLKEFSREKPRCMIYILNHRSNADYVLTSYVLADQVALSFAVGEWARVWPLEYLFKSFGSYFLRRGFRDPLYHTVLRRYVQMVTKSGVTQALFPEGGLSRDGAFRSPKIGLIDYIVTSKEDRSFDRELIFVPVALNYDRVLEDRALVAESKGERPKTTKLEMAKHVGQILFRNVWKFARSKIRKNGIAAVRFGDPVSFDAWHKDQDVDIFSLDKDERRAHIAGFTNSLMHEIAELLPVTPLCVVSKVLIEHAPISREALLEHTEKEIRILLHKHRHVVAVDKGVLWIVEGALMRLSLRNLVEETDSEIRIADGATPILTYYANSYRHFETGEVPRVAPKSGSDQQAGSTTT